MIPSQQKKCRWTIHGAAFVGALVAGGLAQIPASDNAILVPMEILMVLRLGAIFGIRIRDSYRTSLVIGTAATMIGRGVSEVLVGWVPLFGNALDAFTAVGVIEVLGWMVARDFANRRNWVQMNEN